MYPKCPMCHSDSDIVFMKTGKCQYSYPEDSVHKNSGWNTKSVPSKPFSSPPRSVEDELREADDRKLNEANKRKAEEVTSRLRELLKDVLTKEQLDRLAVIRKDDPVVGIPASIFFLLIEKHEEALEELRQIIDGLS